MSGLERLNAANQRELADLNARLVEADLAREVDQEAARTLRDGIRELRDEVASLTEEVTFYKSLMSPSDVARGLQIAEFELLAMEQERRFTYEYVVAGGSWTPELVRPLTEIGDSESYPLKFRFRYFQDLSGVITLPDGFEPTRVVVTADKRGASTANLTRTFDWMVSGREST